MAPAPPTTIRKDYPLLWWTLWFGEARYEGVKVDNCGLPYTCTMTHNRGAYSKGAKVLIFHSPAFYGVNLPSVDLVKSGENAWVLNSLEAPNGVEYDGNFGNIITHSWTYNFKADYPDGYFASGGPNKVGTFIHSALSTPTMALDQKNRLRTLPRPEQGRRGKGRAAVAWVVSHCNTINKREKYVSELRRHIDVDVYGNCGHLAWPVDDSGQDVTLEDLIGSYKFYLSLENQNCDDYVTEKLEKPMRLGTVPIVDGPKDYSRFSPAEKSLIYLDDFENPALLAKYLIELDQDDEKYLEHLKFRLPQTIEIKDPNNSSRNITKIQEPDLSRLSPSFVKFWNNNNSNEVWGPDGHGAMCGLCKLQHEMAEGIAVFDPEKHIGVSSACVMNKHSAVPFTDHDGIQMASGNMTTLSAPYDVLIPGPKNKVATKEMSQHTDNNQGVDGSPSIVVDNNGSVSDPQGIETGTDAVVDDGQSLTQWMPTLTMMMLALGGLVLIALLWKRSRKILLRPFKAMKFLTSGSGNKQTMMPMLVGSSYQGDYRPVRDGNDVDEDEEYEGVNGRQLQQPQYGEKGYSLPSAV